MGDAKEGEEKGYYRFHMEALLVVERKKPQ